ncbi:MAG TPA: hypothetical protein VEB86_03900 [Chryseosolibacter sp.]|nr:hypothetical protein [Chryseosolibacter sp.]
MKKISLWIVALFLLACNEDEKNNCQLSQVEISLGATKQSTFEIFYTNDKVSAIRSTNHAFGNQVETYFIEWDGDHLGKIFREADGATYEEHYVYSYGEMTSTVDYFKISGSDTTAADSQEIFYLGASADGTYYFDGVAYEVQDGNVVRSAFYTEDGGQKVIDEDTYVNFQHDTQPNALRHLLRIPNFLSLGNLPERVSSANNIVEAHYTNGNYTRTVDFEYNNAGNLLNINDVSTGRLMALSYKCK